MGSPSFILCFCSLASMFFHLGIHQNVFLKPLGEVKVTYVPVCPLHYASLFSCFLKNVFIFNWRVISSWYCVGENTINIKSNRTRCGPTDWFRTEKGEWQGYLLSPCFFNLSTEHTMKNAGLDVTSWNQDRQEKHQQPRICRWYRSNGRKQRRTKEPLDEGEGGEWESRLETKY